MFLHEAVEDRQNIKNEDSVHTDYKNHYHVPIEGQSTSLYGNSDRSARHTITSKI